MWDAVDAGLNGSDAVTHGHIAAVAKGKTAKRAASQQQQQQQNHQQKQQQQTKKEKEGRSLAATGKRRRETPSSSSRVRVGIRVPVRIRVRVRCDEHGDSASSSEGSGDSDSGSDDDSDVLSYCVHVNFGNEELKSAVRTPLRVPTALAPAMRSLMQQPGEPFAAGSCGSGPSFSSDVP